MASPPFPPLHLGLGSPSLNIPPLLTEETRLPVQASWQVIGDASRLKTIGLEGTHPYHLLNFGQHLSPAIGKCVSPGPYPLPSPSLPLSFSLLSCQGEPSYPQTLVKWPGCITGTPKRVSDQIGWRVFISGPRGPTPSLKDSGGAISGRGHNAG